MDFSVEFTETQKLPSKAENQQKNPGIEYLSNLLKAKILSSSWWKSRFKGQIDSMQILNLCELNAEISFNN